MNSTLATFTHSNSYYVGFLNHLNTKSHGLKEKVTHWQKSILQSDTKHLSQWEKNIVSWYRFNNVSYHCNEYKISPEKQEILDKYRNDPYYIFKNMVEIMGRDLISKRLRNILKNELSSDDARLQVFISSDSDDVFWWVDVISKIQYWWKTSYLGIDIAVSWNQEYLANKTQKKTQSICMEFNLEEKLPPTTKMPRYVLQFSPEIMAEMLHQYLEAVENGIHIDTLDMYQNIRAKHIKEVQETETTHYLKEVQETTQSWIANLLNL